METRVNHQGLECIRLLNEIICDFDDLLHQPRFKGVEKIKTIGSTYMVATGIKPEHSDKSFQVVVIGIITTLHTFYVQGHVDTIAQFVFQMKNILKQINLEAFQVIFILW